MELTQFFEDIIARDECLILAFNPKKNDYEEAGYAADYKTPSFTGRMEIFDNPAEAKNSPLWKALVKMGLNPKVVKSRSNKFIFTESIESVENVDENSPIDKSEYDDFKQELVSNGDLTSKFDKEFFDAIYPGKGYKDYIKSVDEDLGQIIEDAKNGSEYAECYLLIAARKMAYFVFWKVFIGAKASPKVISARLDNGDFGEFISLMFIAFDKAIKSFKPKIYKDGTMKIGNWQYWFGQYLRMDCIAENNHRRKDHNENAINPDGMEGSEKGGATAWDKLTGDNASFIETDDFISGWKELCDDPELDEPCSTKVDYPKRQLIADVLEGKSLPEIAKDFGVAKNTIYSAANIGELLVVYDIDQSELARELHNNPDRIIGFLRK